MSSQVQIASTVYPDQEHAKSILDMLEKMHGASTITLKDAALVSRGGDGKIHIEETRELTGGKGAKRGAIVAGIFGIIFPPTLIASALVGSAVGGVWGKLRDTGIKNDSLKNMAEDLQPGQVAVVALADEEWIPQIENAMKGYEAEPVLTPLSADESAALEAEIPQGSPTV
jgi:uncharacterized membrane protein